MWCVLIRPRERHGRGSLGQPGGRQSIDLKRWERAEHLSKIGGKQGIHDMPQAVIMERGPGSPWLQQLSQAALCQPLPHLLEGMMAVQHREDPGFDPTPTREHMRWMGRDEAGKHRGDLQAPEDAQDQRSMRHGIPLLHGYGPHAPPVVVS